jgi:hypothetical protein
MKYHLRFANRMCLLGILFYSWIVTQAQTATEAWVRRYNSPEAGSQDYTFKVVTDTAGNAIVAGYTDDGYTGRDMLVTKYSGAGVPLWTNRYNSLDNWDDQANAVAVDGSGNVFVTGYSGLNLDYVTIAYSGAGVALWTNRYDGPFNHIDIANAVAVDGSGNVFVTGGSINSGTSYDYATVAYSGAGVPLWTNRYAGPELSDDRASALAVDGTGNVFVTGNSATVGYSGAGVSLWTNRNSGAAVAVDSGGNVFVTGFVYTLELNNDYETVAYSAAGVPRWTNRYDGPNRSGDAASAVAVDSSGNVFVTGNSTDSRVPGTRSDYATIAYSGMGVALWTNRYNGAQNTEDRAWAVAVDQNGNVFVTGSSYISWSLTNSHYATIGYSAMGVALWTNRYDAPGNLLESAESANSVAVDGSGKVFVTASSIGSGGDHDAAVIAYSAAGIELWTNHYNRPGNSEDIASAMAVGSNGTVFVTGSSAISGLYYPADYVTIAYSEAGVALWTNRYNGLGNGDDRAAAVAVDNSGRVFVTGSSSGSNDTILNPGYDYATVAYSAAGTALWTNRYDRGLGYGDDRATAVAVDNSGRVFVTGYSTGSGFGGGDDYVTIAYSGAGIALWTNRYNGSAVEFNANDQANAVKVDNSGNVFVTGYSFGVGSGQDYATIAYSGTGVPLWTNRYNGPGNGGDNAADMAIDNRGNVFVTGSSMGSGSTSDYATVAYSGAGVALWTNRYNGTGNSNDYASAIAVDSNGNVFVTGYSHGSGSHYDYATIAYSRAGVALWTNRYNGPDNLPDSATAVTADSSSNVFVTGSSANSGPFYSTDYVTIAYSGVGVPLWTNRYDGPGIGGDDTSRRGLAVGRDGAVYVTGSSDGGNWVYDYTTIKYVWRPYLAIQPLTVALPAVNLTLSGPTNSSWSIQRALTLGGQWTNLGVSLIGTNGSAIFPDANPPAKGALYRATQP